MSVSVKVELTGHESVLALLDRLPKLVVAAGGPTDKAVGAAAKSVARRAVTLAPDSRKNPKGDSRKKQSKKSKGIWTAKLKQTVRQKVIKYESGAWAIVGPKSPQGNMAHFMQEKPRVHVLWGKASAVKHFRDTRNWIVKAFDETKSEQLSAMEASLKNSIDENMRS